MHPSKTELIFDISHYPLKEEAQKIKQVEIFTKKGKWFISITYELQEPEYLDNGKYQAIDLGVILNPTKFPPHLIQYYLGENLRELR